MYAYIGLQYFKNCRNENYTDVYMCFQLDFCFKNLDNIYISQYIFISQRFRQLKVSCNMQHVFECWHLKLIIIWCMNKPAYS